MSEENNYADFSNEMLTEPVKFEPPIVAQEVADAVQQALVDIRGRSFSGRHPELGKMIKCPVCGLRHRAAQKCEQRFKAD